MSKKIYFTPGPSELYFTVEGHLKTALREQVGSISHRSQAFKNIYKETEENLRTLLNLPADYKVFFTSSATEIWEHLIRNCVENESYHLVNGAFSKRFWEFSGLLGRTNLKHESEEGNGAKPGDLNIPGSSELIGITLNESSTGVSYPLDWLKYLRSTYQESLIAVDGVSSIPIPEIDFSQIDSAYFSVQKCFGLPAGLGVWLVGPRCMEKAREMNAKGLLSATYRSLLSLEKSASNYQTVETPNVLAIYLLGKVVIDMLVKGIDTIRRESRYKAAVLHQMIDDLDWLSEFIPEKELRSETVVVANCTRDNDQVVKQLEEAGFVIGKGYGKFKTSQLRFANFPTHSREQVEQLADVMAKI